MKKDSFILHNDSLEILEELTDEEAGKLFKEIYIFHSINFIPSFKEILG